MGALLKRFWAWLGPIGKLNLLATVATSGAVSAMLLHVVVLVRGMDPVLKVLLWASVTLLLCVVFVSLIRLLIAWFGKGVTVTIENKSFFGLVVGNDGPPATFTAQIKVIEHDKFIPVPKDWDYHGVWHSSQRQAVFIPQGHKERLIVGDFRQGIREGYQSSDLRFYYFAPIDRVRKEFLASYAPPLLQSKPKPELLVEITISADPALPGGPIVRRYRLTMDGLTPGK